MKYRKLKGTDIESSVIFLGTDGYGSGLDKETSLQLLDSFVELGGKGIDTANIYGYPTQESEKTIGKWIKERGNRNRLLLATKGGHPNPATMQVSRLSSEELQADLELSLKNLNTDYIDLYWLHRDDRNIPAGEIIERLNLFLKEGKIRAIGCSNWYADRIKEANDYAAAHGLTGFCASQIKWSLAKTSDGYVDDPTLVEMNETDYQYYLERGVSVMAYASQAKGFFSKFSEGGAEALSQKASARYLSEENVNKCRIAEKIARENNCSVAAVVLAYLLRQPFDVYPIVGCKNTAQLKDSISAADVVISDEDFSFLK